MRGGGVETPLSPSGPAERPAYSVTSRSIRKNNASPSTFAKASPSRKTPPAGGDSPQSMLMCGKVTHKNLIDSNLLFRKISRNLLSKMIQYNSKKIFFEEKPSMNQTQYNFSTSKTLVNILVYFLLFLAGDLFSSIPFDLLFSFVELPSNALYVILRMLGALLLTIFLFWLYTTKGLHLKMKDFGITPNIKKWGVLISVFLPVFVTAIFAMIGKFEVNSFSAGEICLIVIASMLIALKSGITEEMLFRGYIMKLLESRWNKYIAILIPSFLFSLVHIPSMETFTVSGVLLLIISGTVVGIMFSLVSYKGKSISNSALLHAAWNFIMITDILHITTAQGTYGSPIFSIIISSDNVFLTGAGFGIEASIIAIIGYILVCGFVLIPKKK